MAEANKKKRHHYIPRTYLRHFCDDEERLWVLPKDSPKEPFRTVPASIGLERYYYSQHTPDGDIDHNKLEDFFADIEDGWNEIVGRWQEEDPANDVLENVFEFLSLMRARVPAARDMVELALAETAMMTLRALIKKGEVPPPPTELRLEDIIVTIDPHKSLEAMVQIIKGMAIVFDRIGFEVIHNDSDMRLVTSDNPISYFDPTVPDARLRPYTIHPEHGPIELLFPISPYMMLRGHSDLKFAFACDGLAHRRSRDREEMKRFNRMTSRFAYRLIFARDLQSVPVVVKLAPLSPIMRVTTIETPEGEMSLREAVFGERPNKPKWKGAKTPAEATS